MSLDADCRIEEACAKSAAEHGRLCPRQVIGVRMGLAAGSALDLVLPPHEKRLLIIAETDGCFVDGVTAATGCSVGHRTLRVIDSGRVAITAVDVETGRAVRLAPAPGVRERALEYASPGVARYQAQLEGYQRMSEDELLRVEPVDLAFDLKALIGRPGIRVDCSRCGEEILNGRESSGPDGPVCDPCHGRSYYRARPVTSLAAEA